MADQLISVGRSIFKRLRDMLDGSHAEVNCVVPQDHYGIQQYLAPNGEIVAVPLYKLVGDVFFGADVDTSLWTPTPGTGNISITGGQLVMSTGATADGSTSVVSVHTARFSGLAPNKLRAPLQCPDGGTANNIRRWGVGTALERAFFELDGSVLKCVTRRNGTDTAVSSGSFVGQYGTGFTMGVNSHFFEVIYQPRQIVWLADNKIIHTKSAVAAPWANNLHMPIFFENFNTNGSTTNVELQVRLATIARFGIPEVQVDGHFHAGTTAGILLKRGPGNLHFMNLSGVQNLARVILYDGVDATGSVIDDTGAMGPQTIPLSLPYGGEAYNNGLFMVKSGAACNTKVVYE